MKGITQFMTGSLSFNQKVRLGAAGAVAVIGILVFSLCFGPAQESVLLANLSPEDAFAALDELAALDVTAKLVNGGTAIVVPADDVQHLRAELAARGVPASIVAGNGRRDDRLKLRREVEEYLSGKAGSMLDRVLGAGRSIVRVDAVLGFEMINPERKYRDRASIAGLSSARPEAAGIDAGGLRYLSVAVFVDGHYGPDGEDGALVYTPLSDGELRQLQRIVQAAVGVNLARGDQIEVVNMQFQRTAGGFAQRGGGGASGRTGLVGLFSRYGERAALLVVLGVIALMLRHSVSRLAADGSRRGDRSSVSAFADGIGCFDGDPDLNNETVQDIQEYATENPERVAEVIQSWILNVDESGHVREAAGE